MKRRYAIVAAALVLAGALAHAEPKATSSVAPVASPHADAVAEHYHYSITARVRPLVVFWITRSGVGDAFLTRRLGSEEAHYSLLIGSDPARTPMHINRWGYIDEETRGAESRLIGLMTESDEESVEQAEAGVRSQLNGRHPFKVIRASADGERSYSQVRSIAAPQDYTYRHLSAMLDLAQRDGSEGRSRVVPVPAGARAGFLSALAELMHEAAPHSIQYMYFGKLYELRRTRADQIADARVGSRSYGAAVSAEFVTTDLSDREETRFSIVYATQGDRAGVPLKASYQPRWWMQIELAIDDGASGELQ